MDPERIDSVLDEANRLLEAGRPDESLRRLESVADELLDSDDRIECAALRAYALSEMGRTDEALQTLDPLLAEFPDSARLFGALGVVLSGANHLEQARAALETAVTLDAEDETLLANLALVYEKLRDYRTAIRLYERALELGADLDWALQRKAYALAEAGEVDEAKATLKRYLSLVPDDIEQWIALAILHSDDEEYPEAYACYRQVEQIEPDSASLRLNWGVTAVRAGNLSVARRQLEHLRRVEPDSARPLLLRAFILEEQRRVDEAAACYEQALERVTTGRPGELAYTLEMAMDFFARQEQRERCEALFQRAYAANACTVDLCEPYRELTGEQLPRGYWFSLVVEADYRDGLHPVFEPGEEVSERPRRYQRNFQVVARDHDEAVQLVLDVMQRHGETGVLIREFLREEPLEDVHSGLYEIERESYILPSA